MWSFSPFSTTFLTIYISMISIAAWLKFHLATLGISYLSIFFNFFFRSFVMTKILVGMWEKKSNHIKIKYHNLYLIQKNCKYGEEFLIRCILQWRHKLVIAYDVNNWFSFENVLLACSFSSFCNSGSTFTLHFLL